MYELWLLDCGSRKIQVIKELRGVTGLGLREAKDLAEGGGLVVRRDDDRQVEAAARLLVEAGARVEVRPSFTRRWYVFDPNLGADQELVRVALGGTLVEKRRMRFGDPGAAELVRAATDEAAQEMAILEVARLRSQGCSVVETELDAFRALAHRSPDLERSIEAAPDDLSAYQVYADWLLDRGDAWGELISLSLAGADTSSWLAKHASAVLGPLARSREMLRISWKHGAIDTLVIEKMPLLPEEEVIEALIHLPAAHRLRRLEAPASLQHALVAAQLPKSCTGLALRVGWFEAIDQGAIASLARRFDHLAFSGDYLLKPIALDSDRLKSLSITAGEVNALLPGIARSHLPALAQLNLHDLGIPEGIGDEEAWPELLAARLPSLRELTLIDIKVDLRLLLRSRMVQQLSVLRLSGSTVRPENEHVLQEEARNLGEIRVIRD